MSRRHGRGMDDLRDQVRTVVDQQELSTTPRQFAYGYVRLDTDVVFREIDKKGRLHLVVAITGDEIDEVAFWEIDGILVEPSSQTNSNGNVTSGRYKGLARLEERLGKPGQGVLSTLRHETSVDSNFRGTGIAYLYGRFKFKDGVFSGDPKIRVIVKARKPIDPRDGVQRWTINPLVMAYDALIKSKQAGGAGRPLDQIDLPSWQAAASFGEGLVDAKAFSKLTRVKSHAVDQLVFTDQPVNDFQWGDVVQLLEKDGNGLPAGLTADTDYHVIPRRHRAGDIGETGFPSIRLASSFANAMDRPVPLLYGPCRFLREEGQGGALRRCRQLSGPVHPRHPGKDPGGRRRQADLEGRQDRGGHPGIPIHNQDRHHSRHRGQHHALQQGRPA